MQNNSLEHIYSLVSQGFEKYKVNKHPENLYQPIDYILELGGKRLRPVLTLLSAAMFNKDVAQFLQPAMAVEVFHNFTLMHDDIMDQAPLRRGKETVHTKWNTNIAILSGDVMLVKAYDLLLQSPVEHLPTALSLFNKCAIEVCEGQQLDMDFEQRNDVQTEEYIEMIRLKTAVLLGFALELGGLLADATVEQRTVLQKYGELIGIGFQLKDDLLDVFGESAKVGKQVGGDIISNKKTYLLLTALQKAEGKTLESLQSWIAAEKFNPEEKVQAVKAIYEELNIKADTEVLINSYFESALALLLKLNVGPMATAQLKNFTLQLINRDK